MNLSEYLVQRPQLKTNSARSAMQRQAAAGGPFGGIVQALLSVKADNVDNQNAQALAAYADQEALAQKQLEYDREGELYQRKRQDALADRTAQFEREDQTALRNRGWSLQDQQAGFANQKQLLEQKQQGDMARYLQQYGGGGEPTAYEKAFASAQGKSAAENRQNYENQKQLFQSAKQLTDQLRGLAKEATYHPLGRAADAVGYLFGNPTKGAIAREKYNQTVSNEILPKLKQYLGGQFTEKEGKRLMDTLGNLNATPAEKNAAIDAFMDARTRAYNEAKNKAFGVQDLAAPQEGAEEDGYIFLGGNPADAKNWRKK